MTAWNRNQVTTGKRVPADQLSDTGRLLTERKVRLSWYSVSRLVDSRFGYLSASALNTSCPSTLAMVAPRQWCTPAPKATWGLGHRVMSKVSGSSNLLGSRLAEGVNQRKLCSFLSFFPLIYTSLVAIRWIDFTGGS